MADEKGGLTLNRISSGRLLQETGRDWEGWLRVLDAAGAADLDHKGVVGLLERAHPELDSAWWRQTITVGYEQARGKRVLGQTAGAGFQLGVRRSIGLAPAAVWRLLTRRPELWLGDDVAIAFEKGERYRTAGGEGIPPAGGEIRVVKPEERLRMTWQPEGWSAPATLQFTLTATGSGGTALQLHLEKLPDAEAREEMRGLWRTTLERIAGAGDQG
jgi:uncharacterized protein YndB with AHSA1/START domain